MQPSIAECCTPSDLLSPWLLVLAVPSVPIRITSAHSADILRIGIYLLLRRFVDHTPLDEVFVIDDRTKYGLEDLIQQSAEQSAETAS